MQTRKGTSLLESIPQEIQQHIFNLCDTKAVQPLRQCSATLFGSINSLIEHEKNILIKHYLDHYNLDIAPNFQDIVQQPHQIVELCSWASNEPAHACNTKPILPPSLLETACRLRLKNLGRELIKLKHPSDTILKSVIFDNNLTMLDELLQLNIAKEVNFHTFDIPALLWAIRLERTDCARILLNKGATLDEILDFPLLGGTSLSSANGWQECKVFQIIDLNALNDEMKSIIDPDGHYQSRDRAIEPSKLTALNKCLADEIQLLTMKGPARLNCKL